MTQPLPEIASLWIGGRLSWLEQLCLKSFADAGHHITLYSYSPIDNIPEGVHAGDASEIFPADPMYRHARTGSPAIHADLWRLNLLKKTDKIWVDADMYCYRPFDFARPSVFGWEKPGLVCNAVLGLPKESPALNGLLTFFEDKYAIAPWLKDWQQEELREAKAEGNPVHMTEQEWGFTGPASVTWFLKDTGEIEQAEPESAFYPIPFPDRNHLIMSKFNIEERLTDKTKGIHFWARRMKPRLEEKENNTPRRGSFMEGLIEKHGIDPAAAPIPPKKPAADDSAMRTPRGRKREMPSPKMKAAPVYDTPLALLLGVMAPERALHIVDIGADPTATPSYAGLLAAKGCVVTGFDRQPTHPKDAETTPVTPAPAHSFGDGGDVTLHICRDAGMTSVYPAYEGAISYLGRSRWNAELLHQVSLPTRRVDDSDDIADVDVIKIDVHGAEAQVITGARDSLENAVCVMPTVRHYPIFDGAPTQAEVDAELRAQGFQLHKYLSETPKVIPNSQIDRLKRTKHRNQIIDSTAIYIRDPATVDDWDDDQLRYLALAAAGVFESHDLVLFCLDRLVDRGAVPNDLPSRYVDTLPQAMRKE